MTRSVKEYYRLTKPGIVYGNTFTTFASFLYASHWYVSLPLLFATLLGIAFVIGSACVFNNYIDRDIDRKMKRTSNRALVLGTIGTKSALTFASILGLCGMYLLYEQANALTALVALAGFVMYVIVYGWAKRASHWGTVVGSFSGAIPIVVGYTAVSNQLDAPAVILFLTLALWQMPHFYAIALYRHEDYKAAHIPVLPSIKGALRTKIYAVVYVVAFIATASSLTLGGYAGYVYLVSVLSFGFFWLWYAIMGFQASSDIEWARSFFRASLVVLMSFSIALSFAAVLP